MLNVTSITIDIHSSNLIHLQMYADHIDFFIPSQSRLVTTVLAVCSHEPSPAGGLLI